MTCRCRQLWPWNLRQFSSAVNAAYAKATYKPLLSHPESTWNPEKLFGRDAI